MEQATQIINRVLPVLLLIGLGYWLRRQAFLAEKTVEDLRKMVVYLALPAVLFISFAEMELKPSYIAIFVLMFVLCIALFGVGFFLKRRLGIQRAYFPFLMTGFEYGMLGVSLFGSVYGIDQIGYIAIMDLGHELFIWFVFLAFLLRKRDGLEGPGQLARAFATSPVIVGILAGIALNVLGLQDRVYAWPVTGGLVAMLRFLGDLTIPLILVIIGYGIKFDRERLREAAPVIVGRLVLLVPLALILNRVFIRGMLGLGPRFEAALFTLLILPPPFIIPLYMKTDAAEERRYINNVLTLYTAASVTIFSIYYIVTTLGG